MGNFLENILRLELRHPFAHMYVSLAKGMNIWDIQRAYKYLDQRDFMINGYE